jgi:hypothetical protein
MPCVCTWTVRSQKSKELLEKSGDRKIIGKRERGTLMGRGLPWRVHAALTDWRASGYAAPAARSKSVLLETD